MDVILPPVYQWNNHSLWKSGHLWDLPCIHTRVVKSEYWWIFTWLNIHLQLPFLINCPDFISSCAQLYNQNCTAPATRTERKVLKLPCWEPPTAAQMEAVCLPELVQRALKDNSSINDFAALLSNVYSLASLRTAAELLVVFLALWKMIEFSAHVQPNNNHKNSI